MMQRQSGGLFVRDYPGEPEALPLVWIHGLGESGLCFEAIAEHPSLVGRRQLVPDLPGYGRSCWDAEPASLTGIARRLRAWLAAEGVSRYVLVGHSMGGVLGLEWLEDDPSGVAGLVNVDGNVSIADCAFSGQAMESDLASFVAGGFDRLRDGIYRDGVEDPALRGYYASLRLADPRSYHRHSGELVDASRPETIAARLAALEVPQLYVAGGPGGACARSLELLAAAGVPKAVIEPSGHWPFIDQPDAFAAALGGFLAGTLR